MIIAMMGRKKVDRNTLLLLHFDGSLKDEASGKPYVGSNMSYVVGKFKNCVSFSGNGYVKISGTNAINESLYPNYTVDFWIKLKSGVKNGIMSKGVAYGSYSFDIMEESDGRIFFGFSHYLNFCEFLKCQKILKLTIDDLYYFVNFVNYRYDYNRIYRKCK